MDVKYIRCLVVLCCSSLDRVVDSHFKKSTNICLADSRHPDRVARRNGVCIMLSAADCRTTAVAGPCPCPCPRMCFVFSAVVY